MGFYDISTFKEKLHDLEEGINKSRETRGDQITFKQSNLMGRVVEKLNEIESKIDQLVPNHKSFHR